MRDTDENKRMICSKKASGCASSAQAHISIVAGVEHPQAVFFVSLLPSARMEQEVGSAVDANGSPSWVSWIVAEKETKSKPQCLIGGFLRFLRALWMVISR